MLKVLKYSVILCCLSISISRAANQPFSPIIPETRNGPVAFLGPTLQGRYTGWMTNTSAYSFLGEVAPKNYRVGLTAAWKLGYAQRIKFSGEYLWQRLNYSFVLGGHTQEWVQQGALGMDYLFHWGDGFFQSVEIDVYASHAPNKNIHDVAGSNTVNRITTPLINNRRIAGSNAGGVAPGVNFALWAGNLSGVDLNWDEVRYDNTYSSKEHASGLGGTLRFEQRIGHHARVFLLAALRKPFNNYQGSLNWDNWFYHGRWSSGIFGEYTSGKEHLPNSYNIGLNFNYYADACDTAIHLKDEVDYKNEMPVITERDPEFLTWASDPAVYMPQVLAIVDQNVRPRCEQGSVTFFGTIPAQFALGPGNSIPPLDIKPFFIGNNLTYTISSITPQLGFGDTITLDPITGILNATVGFFPSPSISYSVTVTASNACGSATSTPFFVHLF